MPHSVSHARKLLRKMPDRPGEILKRPNYWDLTFLRVYLDRCDHVLFNDPKAGFKMAELAVELAPLISDGSPHEWQVCASAAEKQQHLELRVRSIATLGGACRAAGKLRKADKVYRSALEVADAGQMSVPAKADLSMRLAKLRSAQGKFEVALELAAGAIGVFRNRDRIQWANALVTKGYVLGESSRHSEAIPFFAEALELIRPSRRASSRASRVFHSAVHNLASALSHGCYSEHVIQALPFLAEARKYFRGQRNSINKQKLVWVEARIHSRLACTADAERRFLSAYQKFLELGAPLEAALLGLELSLLYLKWREWTKLQEIAVATFEAVHALSMPAEELAALRLWVEGARMRSLTAESVRSARDSFEAKVARDRSHFRG